MNWLYIVFLLSMGMAVVFAVATRLVDKWENDPDTFSDIDRFREMRQQFRKGV